MQWSSELNSPIPVHFSSLFPKMLMFTLAISCLTTSNLPWFMDLTFQVLMQYCSLQHRTLLPSPVTSTTDYCFCFGSISSFFLELFPHWSPGAYWAPTNLGNSSFSVISFCFFMLFMGFSRQEYWSGLTFPLTTFCQNSPPWPICLGWPCTAWLIVSLREIRLWSMWSDWLVFCDCGFHSVCTLMDNNKRLLEASWLRRKLGLVLMGRAMHSKSLI